MKKYIVTLALTIMGMTQMFALSNSSIRTHARFLTDRMAYELDLSPMQYDDIYEINYDYIYMIDRIMDDVVYGYRDALDRYYDLLDDRNDDIRYVLTSSQYRKFRYAEYFYRPVYSTGRTWSFRIYTIYSNRTFFYYDAPRSYKTYMGEHSHHKYTTHDYYHNRYSYQSHDRYNEPNVRIKIGHGRTDIQKHDFGTNVRERNNNEKNKVNNYKNTNSTNRTSNKYYQDNSGNKNAQEINNRNRTSSANTSNTNNTGSNSRSTSTTTTSTSRNNTSNQRSGQGANSR